MKIIHVTSYYPPHIGGIENVVRSLAISLAKKGIKTMVLSSDIPKGSSTYEEMENLRVYRLKSFEIAHTSIMLSLARKLASEIDKDTIVHVHAGHAFTPEVSAVVSKLKRCPLIVHVHSDVSPSGTVGFLLPVYKRFVLKRVLSTANKVIFLTNEHAHFLSKKYGISRNNIEVIPNGINLDFFKTKRRTKSKKKTKLIFVGRLSKEKNVPRLLKALSMIVRKYDIVLHIVGDGEGRSIIERMIKKEKMGENVVLHGPLYGEKLKKMYYSCDIFVLSSDSEGMPLAMMEAMATGLPVISCDTPGIKSFAKDSILLVDRNPEDLANGIVRLIEDQSFVETLKKRSYQLIKHYDWKIISEKFIEVYKEVLKK